MKTITKLSLLFMIMLNFIGSSQTSKKNYEITGKVTIKSGEPAPFATIMLGNTKYATSSDEKGDFYLYAPQGDYIITVSYVGYKSIKTEFTVNPEGANTINFVLEESSTLLQEVEIIGRKEKGYKNTNSFVLHQRR